MAIWSNNMKNQWLEAMLLVDTIAVLTLMIKIIVLLLINVNCQIFTGEILYFIPS